MTECDHLNWPRFGPSAVANCGPAWVMISPDGWAGAEQEIDHILHGPHYPAGANIHADSRGQTT